MHEGISTPPANPNPNSNDRKSRWNFHKSEELCFFFTLFFFAKFASFMLCGISHKAFVNIFVPVQRLSHARVSPRYNQHTNIDLQKVPFPLTFPMWQSLHANWNPSLQIAAGWFLTEAKVSTIWLHLLLTMCPLRSPPEQSYSYCDLIHSLYFL